MAANSLPMTLSPRFPLPSYLPLCHALHRLSCFSFRICISPLTPANREQALALTHSCTSLSVSIYPLSLSLSLSSSHVSVCFRALQFFRAWELPAALFVSHLPFFKCLRHVHAKFKCLPFTPLSLSLPLRSLGALHGAWATAQFSDNLR